MSSKHALIQDMDNSLNGFYSKDLALIIKEINARYKVTIPIHGLKGDKKDRIMEFFSKFIFKQPTPLVNELVKLIKRGNTKIVSTPPKFTVTINNLNPLPIPNNTTDARLPTRLTTLPQNTGTSHHQSTSRSIHGNGGSAERRVMLDSVQRLAMQLPSTILPQTINPRMNQPHRVVPNFNPQGPLVQTSYQPPTHPVSYPQPPTTMTGNYYPIQPKRSKPIKAKRFDLDDITLTKIFTSFFYKRYAPIRPFLFCPPSSHRASVRLHLKFSTSHCEFFNSTEKVSYLPGLKLFCAPLVSFEEHGPIFCQFPAVCELIVNGTQISCNLKGKKNQPGTVRPPDLDKLIQPYLGFENTIELVYANSQQAYVLIPYLVTKQPVQDLVAKIKAQHFVPEPQVREELFSNGEDDVVATIELSLKCPLGFTRIKVPMRSKLCQHAQCFDASNFLLMNEQMETWVCPICQIKIDPFNSLIVDGFFQSILDKVKDEESVMLESDGSWKLKNIIEPKSKIEKRARQLDDYNIVDLDSDDEVKEPSPKHFHKCVPTSAVANKDIDIIDLTETDDEDQYLPTLSQPAQVKNSDKKDQSLPSPLQPIQTGQARSRLQSFTSKISQYASPFASMFFPTRAVYFDEDQIHTNYNISNTSDTSNHTNDGNSIRNNIITERNVNSIKNVANNNTNSTNGTNTTINNNILNSNIQLSPKPPTSNSYEEELDSDSIHTSTKGTERIDNVEESNFNKDFQPTDKERPKDTREYDFRRVRRSTEEFCPPSFDDIEDYSY